MLRMFSAVSEKNGAGQELRGRLDDGTAREAQSIFLPFGDGRDRWNPSCGSSLWLWMKMDPTGSFLGKAARPLYLIVFFLGSLRFFTRVPGI